MVSPSQKRRAIKHVIEQGKGTTAEACRAMNLQRSTYYRNSTVRPERQKMERAIVDLSEDHPRYGYRRITVLVRRKGELITPSECSASVATMGCKCARSNGRCGERACLQPSANVPPMPTTSGVGILWKTKQRMERVFAFSL